MISAMYENGGNTTLRLLDGHPQLFVYPFESQLGTRRVSDLLSSVFPVKYRWPVFETDGSPGTDYEEIIDEECKVRTRTPHVSKFRDVPFDLADSDRRRRFVERMGTGPRTRGRIVEAFFRATFEAWKDRQGSGAERAWIGYSPIVVVDAGRILADLPGARVLHVVRNPWSAYADTKKRPVPMSLESYMVAWSLCQYYALAFQELHPDRVRVVRFEDVIRDPVAVLGRFCADLGVESAPTLARPTWNGRALESVYPWGTIRTPTPEANLATAQELGGDERRAVEVRAGLYLRALGYANFLAGGLERGPALRSTE